MFNILSAIKTQNLDSETSGVHSKSVASETNASCIVSGAKLDANTKIESRFKEKSKSV